METGNWRGAGFESNIEKWTMVHGTIVATGF
jgi:hypothetical protein